MAGKKTAKKTKSLLWVMLVAALAVFVFSAYKVFGEIWQKQQEQNAFEELSQQIETNVVQPEKEDKRIIYNK